jgi:pyrroloquinoline quinone (PQQ) biosynthesis protein C/mannose-6-phosphate isomerase-like protein (cupin superfamily)
MRLITHPFEERARALLDTHAIWQCELLKSMRNGRLSRTDFRYLFAQYSFYSQSFTRILAAAMSRCDDEKLRAKLMHNLWEESGEGDAERSHAAIFRLFLRETLELDLEAMCAEPCAKRFVERCLLGAADTDPVFALAFVAFGIEAIVVRLYSDFLVGLEKAEIRGDGLRFFSIHVECDDAHAATLIEMLASYRDEPGFEARLARGMNAALDARLDFFNEISQNVQHHRLAPILAAIAERNSLCDETLGRPQIVPLYSNARPERSIAFQVDRLFSASAQCLDVRRLEIAVGATTELHRHAHESAFVLLEGIVRVEVNGHGIALAPGETAFVPRWAMHQTINCGAVPARIIAITDYGLTRTILGEHDHEQREKKTGLRSP